VVALREALHTAVDRRGTTAPTCARGSLVRDETYVKVAGRWVYLYRAIDQFGQVIDVLAPQSGT
jgi:transposase-like protein